MSKVQLRSLLDSWIRSPSLALLGAVLIAGACGSSAGNGDPGGARSGVGNGSDAGVATGGGGVGGGGGGGGGGGQGTHDLATVPLDLAGTDLTVPSGGSDGPPMRQACTNTFGGGIGSAFGRLDGYLVAIVPPGSSGCHSDAHHVHLQIQMSGAVYDVAVNVSDPAGIFFTTTDVPLPDGAWSEGWHGGVNLDYVALGLKSTNFTSESEPMLTQTLSDQLKNANHISVFMTPYSSSGGHDVHRHLNGTDGAIVVNPLSATAHLLAFHFANQTF